MEKTEQRVKKHRHQRAVTAMNRIMEHEAATAVRPRRRAMAAAKKNGDEMTGESRKILLKAAKPTEMLLDVVGDSPLIVHRFDEKAQRMIENDQQGEARRRKAPRVPQAEFEASQYRTASGKHGFPAIAFKEAAVSACGTFIEGVTKVRARGAFFVMGDVLPIDGDKPIMRTDMVRIGKFKGTSGTATPRYRAEYKQWRITLPVRYRPDLITPDQLVNIIDAAGFSVGVGERRPQQSEGNSFGMFHVEATKQKGKSR